MLIETPNEPAQPASGRTAKESRRRWHAVVVVASGSACAAVQAYRGRRYLSSEAPRLPLANCDVEACGCRYRHYEDRRGGARRADGDRKRPAVNRRTTKGRRALD